MILYNKKYENIRNLFKLKKENKTIKDKIISDIRNLFKLENEDHYKLIRVGNFYSNNYIKYESNGDRDQNLSVEEYLNKIKSYSKDILIDLQKSDYQKIQLPIAINFISSKDTNKEQTMHSESDKIEVMTHNNLDGIIERHFESLHSRYQISLET